MACASLIAASSWLLDPATWLNWLMVALGLGFVIFVHELGHFLVAKACGVKCEKFYIGFDVFGLRLGRFQWGETEYGIGALPLGGYVKMLGQDDNPARAAAEMERARLAASSGQLDPNDPHQAELLDPRSYLAKSVPQRMAIISAGVVMNVIFAVVMAMAAYGLGVEEVRCVVGSLLPGQPAWRAGLRPGDTIVQVGHVKNPRFRDLQTGVVLGDNLEEGVPFVVERPGVAEPLTLRIVPDRSLGAPVIGITSSSTTQLQREAPIRPLWDPALEKHLLPGDVIVEVDGRPVPDNLALQQALTRNRGRVTLGIDRAAKPKQPPERVAVELPPRPMRILPVVMEMGPITALRADSPAAGKLQPGDVLTHVDGQPIGDPLRLPFDLLDRGGQTIRLTVQRGGQPVEVALAAESDRVHEPLPWMLRAEQPMTIPSLGVAYAVEGRVRSDSRATGGLKPGDQVATARLIPPAAEEGSPVVYREVTFTLDWEKKRFWPSVFFALQDYPLGTKLEVTLVGGQTATLEPTLSTDWFDPDRGLQFEPLVFLRRAESWGDALWLAWRETYEDLTLVYRFLRKIFSGQVSATNLAGPVGIVRQASASASAGWSPFLIFLVMLSANLAVVNFLPIPVLDGGHMVFLALEGIRGKPVSERVFVAFQYVGLVFILSLMAFVLSLDVGREMSSGFGG